ncbi:S-locus glycoprotein [Corchorus capsularis]|uniref:S-locus glycoprotein n=1 Tax=Corchorus capsularis TaxID=210143 RepID=A0A1R3IQG7_COCAP|nr:S-locus glycoprotein [Corchorus capsularis]
MDKKKNPWLILSVHFIYFSLNYQLSFGADTISANQTLSGDQTIVSSGGNFELGFFKPGNSSNYYIGMWYGRGLVSEQTPVWVANRETPIRDRFSAELRISDGNLVLFNESQVPIWSTNISSSTGSSSVIAVLEDTGNLVLKDGPNSSTLLWQSLEHPSHTWLPGGQIKQLSWLDGSKQWNLFWSQPRQQCEVYAFCGAFGSCSEKGLPFCTCLQGFQPKSQGDWNNLTDYSGGCQRKTKLRCEDPTLPNVKEDKFLELPNMVFPEHPQSMSVGSNSECESTCLNNCSCTAYAYDSDGCKIWIGELLNVEQLAEDASNGKTLFIRLAASEFSSSSNNKGIIIGAAAGSVGLILLVAVLGILIWKRRTIKAPKVVEGSLLAFGIILKPEFADTEQHFKCFFSGKEHDIIDKFINHENNNVEMR